MIDQGDGDREQKQQQRENLRQVIAFCENKIDCRRSQVLSYFGETFDKSNCNRTCDNCERNTEVTTVDRTNYALKALKLASEIDDRFTLNGLLDAFRGSGAKKALKFQECEHFGCGRELPRLEAERLLQAMVINQVLRSYNQTNPSGFTTSYIKLGPKWKDLENGKMKITLTTAEDEVGGVLKTKKASVTNATVKTSASTKRRVIESSDGEDEEVGYLDEFDSFISGGSDDDIVDDYYEEEIEEKIPSSPVYNNTGLRGNAENKENYVSISKLAPEYQSILYRGKVSEHLEVETVKKGNSSNSSTLNNKSSNTNNNIRTAQVATSVPVVSNTPGAGVCYDYLIQWRDRVAQERKLNAGFVLANGVLGQIARQLPGDLEELSRIPGMTHDKVTKYGNDILSITNRFIL